MANDITHLLEGWYNQRDTHAWVLGTVYQTKGPCYRKPGAMVLFNSLGQQFGLLSGGCLEVELRRQAIRVMQFQQAITLCYDGSDEDDLSFHLGIGCGGTVYILLQPVMAANDYLGLITLHKLLEQGHCGQFWQRIPDQNSGEAEAKVVAQHANHCSNRVTLKKVQNQTWLVTPVKPAIHLLVVGGGIDARPLVALASELGWTVTLCDSRPANARCEYFRAAKTILRCKVNQLFAEPCLKQWDAAVLVTHNLHMDAEAILALQQASSLKYLALLGPQARKQQVLTLAGLNEENLNIPLAGPAGLQLGAELPEGIALSILSECHAVLHQADGHSISGSLERQVTPCVAVSG